MGVNEYRVAIRVALSDYFKHVEDHRIYDDVNDDFIDRLAKDSWQAKSELRELFRQSSGWNEQLQAIVINGTKTHDPDYGYLGELREKIFEPYYKKASNEEVVLLNTALELFIYKNVKGDWAKECIDAINKIAPKAYTPRRKRSRVFKSICDAVGVTDERKGSEFQRLFANFADELNGKKINFKLFVSINPAHFITMSNPKDDERGPMLTSCHSFNCTEHNYNVGCSGYARDNKTFIVFTVSDPDKPELLNNRKLTRMLFMYKPHNGLLLQSRFYNTHGGTSGAQAEADLYRDLVQRELSELEGVPNLWKTEKYCGNSFGIRLNAAGGFGGYPDWYYPEYNAKISVHEHHLHDFKAFEIGDYGRCIYCGSVINSGLYCEECKPDHRDSVCDDCGRYSDDLTTVFNRNGEMINVCPNCLHYNYEFCECCSSYHPVEVMTAVNDNGAMVCESCLAEQYLRCTECGEWFHIDDDEMTEINGDTICKSCLKRHYRQCVECGGWYHVDDDEIHNAYNEDGELVTMCESCLERKGYIQCYCCEYWYPQEQFKAYDRYGIEHDVCKDCLEQFHEQCSECGRYFYRHDGSLIKNADGAKTCRLCVDHVGVHNDTAVG